MRSYTLLVIKTCHRRGAHAMGGMAAQIPIKNDPRPTRRRCEGARRQGARGRRRPRRHLGGAPGLVPIAREIFDAVMPASQNQIDVTQRDRRLRRDGGRPAAPGARRATITEVWQGCART
jgi:malate synthase